MRTLQRLLADDHGATLIEYALLIALIGAAVIGSAQLFGTALQDTYNRIAQTLQSA